MKLIIVATGKFMACSPIFLNVCPKYGSGDGI